MVFDRLWGCMSVCGGPCVSLLVSWFSRSGLAHTYHTNVSRTQGKGRKWKVKDAEGGKPPVYKWKRERRR